jgi:thioredoxin-like negative regulator of GroEL
MNSATTINPSKSSSRSIKVDPTHGFIKAVRRSGKQKAIDISSRAAFESRILQSKGVSVLMLTAPWCIHCVTMKPRLHRLATEFYGRSDVYIVDADKNSWVKEYAKSFPTILEFRDGKEVFRSVGALSYAIIKHNLARELNKRPRSQSQSESQSQIQSQAGASPNADTDTDADSADRCNHTATLCR